MTKHALNAFLATSVTFINEIAALCEQVGADAKEVERGLKSERASARGPTSSPGGAFAGGTLARDVVVPVAARARAPTCRRTLLVGGASRATTAHRAVGAPASGAAAGRRRGPNGRGLGPDLQAGHRHAAAFERGRAVPLAGGRRAPCPRARPGGHGAARRSSRPSSSCADSRCRRRRRRRRAGRGHRVAGVPRPISPTTVAARDDAAARARRQPLPGATRSATTRGLQYLSVGKGRRMTTDRSQGRAALITGANQGLGLAIARAYVAAGASVVLCARDAALLERRAPSSPRWRGAGQQVMAHARRRLEARRRRARWSRDALAAVRRPARAGQQRRRLRPDGPHRGRSTGTSGCSAIEINLFGSVLLCRARAAALQAARATARSSSSPAAARPTRCRASAPTPRRRRRSSASPRRCAEEVRGRRHRRQRHRSRRTEHAPARRGPGGRARRGRRRRSTSGRSSRRSRAATPLETGAALACSSARRRATASPASCSAPSGIRGRRSPSTADELRRAPTSTRCAASSRRTAAWTGASDESRRGDRRLRPDRPEARAGARRARASSPAPTSTCARAEALARTAPGARRDRRLARRGATAADVDIVVVATTNDALAEIAAAAVEAGKHVLVEKPAARIGRRDRPRDRRGRGATRRLVRVGFNHRYHPALQKARELVDAGALGPLMFVRGRYGHGGRVGYEKEWRADPALSGGGELIDQGVHLIDLSRWFLGDFADGRRLRRTPTSGTCRSTTTRFLTAAHRARAGRLAARQLHRVEEPLLARDLRPRRQAAHRRPRRQLRRRAATLLPDAARDGPARDDDLGVPARRPSPGRSSSRSSSRTSGSAATPSAGLADARAALAVVEEIYRSRL